MKKLLGLVSVVLVSASLIWAASIKPQNQIVSMRTGLMTFPQFGYNDTFVTRYTNGACSLFANDTCYTAWVHDRGNVNPYMFSVGINIDSCGAATFTGKLYLVWANDTTDQFLVDSCISAEGVNDFDSSYQEVPVCAAYYRWYYTTSDSCILKLLNLQTSGYR